MVNEAWDRREAFFDRVSPELSDAMAMAEEFESLGAHKKAAATIEEVVSRFGWADSMVVVWAGQRYVRMGMMDRAVEMYRRQAGREPDAEAYYTLGAYARSVGKSREGIPFLLKANAMKRTDEWVLPMFEMLVVELEDALKDPIPNASELAKYYKAALEVGERLLAEHVGDKNYEKLFVRLHLLKDRHKRELSL